MKRTMLILLVVFCMAVLAGCNTLQGFGKDITWVGEKLESASDRD